MVFTATATAEGNSLTNNNTIVTSSSTATGISNISYEEALLQATEIAQNDANKTAIYNANLINHSVSESHTINKEKMEYNTNQINSEPHLTFYYSNLKKYSDIYQTNIGNYGYKQYTITNLYSDIELTNKIGIRTCEKTIYTKSSIINDNYNTCLKYYKLPKGSLFFTDGPSYFIKNEEGTYVTPDGNILRQIVSGKDYYLNKKGLIEGIINNVTSIRTMKLYINN